MKKYTILLIISILISSCSTKKKYQVSQYYNASQQDSVLASILNYIFIAPPYTLMKDRFESQHRSFYTDPKLTSQFTIDKYFVADNGTNYFYVLRPAPKIGEKRGVGGYFKIDDHYKLTGFREIFVTPILTEQEAKTKGEFLFEKMVQGQVDEYLKMKSYVQWPNEASLYDTTTYEWILNKEAVYNQSSTGDSLKIN